VRFHQDVEIEPFRVVEGALEVEPRAAQHGAAGERQRRRAQSPECREQTPNRFLELAVLNNFCDEADGQRLLGGKRAPGENLVQRPPRPH